MSKVMEEVMPNVATDFAISEASGRARRPTRRSESDESIVSSVRTGGSEWRGGVSSGWVGGEGGEVGVGVVEKERYRDGRMCRLRW